jgi:hypothetical protein
MIHITAKALGALLAVIALGVAVAVPSIAAAETEVAPEAPPGAESTLPTPPAEASPSALEEGCEANIICLYNQQTFGSRTNFSFLCSASGAYGTELPRESARNRCGNKTDWLRTNGSVVACMNPGGDRPMPGTFNEVFIAAEYGSFC